MRQRVFNLIILDESGSMCSIKRQAIDGVNETVQTIRDAQNRHVEQDHYLTLVSFNSSAVKTIYDNVEIRMVEELSDAQYCPSCSTPLYDAMGNALTRLRRNVAENDAVLVTVITDGYENASREYDSKAIKALVESLKEKGWVFTYIGANQDVEKVGATIAITNTLSFSADVAGTRNMFARERKARTRWMDRLAESENPMACPADDYFAEDSSEVNAPDGGKS